MTILIKTNVTSVSFQHTNSQKSRGLRGFFVCDPCRGPHGLMDTAVLPQAKRGKEG